MRRAAHGAVAALCGLLVALALAPPAHAQGYRYWSFWSRDGDSWTYATQGPATYRPADGDVLGFRFSVSRDSAEAAKPRGAAGFQAICGETAAKAGTERVALVLDFGTGADAPKGEKPPKPRTVCARTPDDATAADALAAEAGPLRYNSAALLCAIDGYPASGCGEQVSGRDSDAGGHSKDGTAHPAADDAAEGGGSHTSTTVGFVVGAGLVAALGAGAVLQTRRRRG